MSTSILWIGTGGVAGALARHLRMPEPVTAKLSAPFVGLIGTDQETTAAQVRRFAAKIPTDISSSSRMFEAQGSV